MARRRAHRGGGLTSLAGGDAKVALPSLVLRSTVDVSGGRCFVIWFVIGSSSVVGGVRTVRSDAGAPHRG
ncbi:MAG: hypothetical protein M3510_09610 [Actinomycetota bacterium]|nr:hypothetical protein [Actinomycetota bacterium]